MTEQMLKCLVKAVAILLSRQISNIVSDAELVKCWEDFKETFKKELNA